jgi:hypothetical protein
MLQHHDRERGIRAQLETRGRITKITLILRGVRDGARESAFRSLLGLSYFLADRETRSQKGGAMKKRFGWLLPLVFCSSCTSAPTQLASTILEVDAAAVAACHELGFVDGVSSRTCISKEGCEASAKERAREKASSLGATHLVYTDVLQVTMKEAANVRAKAYRCEG